jgi:hypothetical protein
MRHRLNTPAGQEAFAHMLLETNICGLVGRVLLLISREGKYHVLTFSPQANPQTQGNNPDDWNYLRDGFDGLYEAMYGSCIPVVQELAYVAATDWRKVQTQLELLSDGLVPSRVPRKHIAEAIESWSVLGPTSTHEVPALEVCSYPRCAVVAVHMRPPGANVQCGRCYSASYCSKRCQRA